VNNMAKSNKPDLRELLEDAQTLMVQTLLERLKADTLSHQEMAILQKELSRNGVVLAGGDDEDEVERARRKAAADLPDDLDEAEDE